MTAIFHLVSLMNVAPSTPLNLTFPRGSVLNDSITLTWLSPEHPSGIVWFYELQQSSSAGGIFVNTTDNSTTTVLSNLVPGTQYNFSVRAFTVAFGPFSAQLSVHTADGEVTVRAVPFYRIEASVSANAPALPFSFITASKCQCS